MGTASKPGTHTHKLIMAALTWVILGIGGREINFLAEAVIAHYGLRGLVVFKFSLSVVVIIMCELIGRRKPSTGKSLAEWAVAISSIPVAVAMFQLLRYAYSL